MDSDLEKHYLNRSLHTDDEIADMNTDGLLNILDVVLLVGEILQPGGLTSSQLAAADMNADGVINVIDVVLLVNYILV